jgi:hypothetical protein
MSPVDVSHLMQASQNGLVHADALLDFDALHGLPDFAYEIECVLPARGVSALYGPAGGFKSFVAADMALCVATGTSWQGRRVKPGFVVYVAAEGRAGLKRRAATWWEYHGT